MLRETPLPLETAGPSCHPALRIRGVILPRPVDRRIPRRRWPWTLILGATLVVSIGDRLGGRAGQPAVAPDDWFAVEGGRARSLSVPADGKTGFTRLDAVRTGVDFTNVLSAELASRNRILHNGSGVALGDVDGDGLCDIYFCRLEGPNVLYRNRGDWRFEDITTRAGVACQGQWSTGAAFADLDGDGDLDLLVNGIGAGTREFLNDGSGRFTEVRDGRLVRSFGATSLALGDVDGDGDLDLYVANYRTDTSRDRPPGLEVKVWNRDGRIEIEPKGRFVPARIIGGAVEITELGERDFFYLNDGKGRFLPVSFTRGNFLDAEGRPLRAPPQTWALSVVLRDLNSDRIPDIYVCGDFFRSRDVIFLSEGRGRYRQPSWEVFRNMTLSAMGMDVGDLDRDGYDDLLVTEMVSQRHAWRQRQRPELMLEVVQQMNERTSGVPEVVQNTLQHANGDGTYSEIARLAGLAYSEWSWDALFLDVDLDGWEDVLIPTGNLYDVQDADVEQQARRFRQLPLTPENRLAAWALWPPLRTAIGAWHNRRDLTFEPVGPRWGFDQPGVWQGSALGDLDGDGDLDLVVNRLNGPAGLFRNDSPAPRLAVRLRGSQANRSGVGALIRVSGGPVVQTQQMLAGGRYLSSDDYQRVFAAAGAGSDGLTVEVVWRDGRRTVHRGLAPNTLCELWYQAPDAGPAPEPPAPKPWLGDLTRKMAFRHRDAPWNDFSRQPLLSRKFSREGPGLAWGDFDGDGRVELLMGGGRGSTLQGFRYLGRGRLQPIHLGTNAAFRGPHGAVLSWREGQHRWLALGRDHYEGPPEAPGEVVLLRSDRDQPIRLAAPARSVPGPLAVADADGDGDLDLFVGGRIVPGRYPEPASSVLYLRTEAGWEPDPAADQCLRQVGMVRSAIWVDLDGDLRPELVLACEWGPIRVLHRSASGEWTEWTERLGLAGWTGWWNGLAAGDFDGDGRQDLVAGNWGRNTAFQRYLERPLRVWYGDFLELDRVDLVESYFDPDQDQWVPWRSYRVMRAVLPFTAETAPSFRAYGECAVQKLLAPVWPVQGPLEAATLDSMLFLNRGSSPMESRPLPVQAQFAPVFGVAVADFDGDGHQDLALSQNFFSVEPETTRYDAGRALLLLGDGRGGFRALKPAVSGLSLPGQQRGAAVADFDGDGRVDLAIAQNDDRLAVFRNLRGRAGVRLRLEGPASNPGGIGARCRWRRGAQTGPAIEIRCGGGWWSQDGAPVVTGAPAGAELEVRWPDGAVSRVPLTGGAAEVRLVHPAVAGR